MKLAKTTKQTRRELHTAINGLSHAEVAAIVRQVYPRVRENRVDDLAKPMIAGAHQIISPRER